MKWRVLVLGLGVLLAAGCAQMDFPTPTTRPTLTPRSVATNTVEVPTATAPMFAVYMGDVPGDSSEGERLFHTFQPSAGTMCMACHRTDSDERLVGPGLKSVGIRAQTRVEGQSARQYLHTSIVDPSAYVVDGYLNLMPKNWARVFSEAQVDDLVAYLISLSDG